MSEYTWVFADYSQAEARVVAWAGPVPALRAWFREGKDVHTEVMRLIAKTAQEVKVRIPGGLFTAKHWSQYTREDPERDLAKQTVHANNYGMGKRKFALITGLPERYAQVVQDIYFGLFPEIKTGYQAWIIEQLRRSRTITIPQGWPIQFYDIYGPELERAAFSLYAQSTVGMLITKTLVGVSTHFQPIRRGGMLTPTAIRARGLDTRLQIHDALGVRCKNEPPIIEETCRILRYYGEQILVIKGEELVIPMDFKEGPSWGDTHEYKLAH